MYNELGKLLPCFRKRPGGATGYNCAGDMHDYDCPASFRPALAEKLKAQRDEVRIDTLIEAAEKAQFPGFIQGQDTEWDEGVNYAKQFIAEAILRLIEKPDLSGAKQAVVKAASKLKFGAYPAHGSGLVLIVTDGNVDELRAALDALQSAQAKGGAQALTQPVAKGE